MRTLFLYEIAHLIVSDKVGTVDLMKRFGIEASISMTDELIFQAIIENKANEKFKSEIFKAYDKNPLNQYCVTCFDTIRSLHETGKEISMQLKSKS